MASHHSRPFSKVGRAAAEAVLRAGLPLVPMTITGEPREVTEKQGMVIDGPTKTSVKFIGIEDRETSLREIQKDHPNLIIVDFTLPSVVNGRLPWQWTQCTCVDVGDGSQRTDNCMLTWV